MAKRDRAAIDIDLFGVPTELFANRQRLNGERLVRLDKINLIEPAR